MAQPIISARRIYSRYVANQTLEDYSLRYTAKEARKNDALSVSSAALGSISFLALEVIGANIAIFYGLNHLLLALLIGMVIIFCISKPIAKYAVKYNVDIDLLTRGSGFGYLGSSIASLVYASFTFIFLAFEATIIANLLDMAIGLPLWIGYFISAMVVIPLILNGFTFINKFQRHTQLLWGLLQLFSIIGAVLLLKDSSFSIDFINYGENFNLLYLGYSLSVLMALISQIGEQVDYLRFMPQRTSANKLKYDFGLLLSGPGWIVMGGVKILIGALIGVYLLHQGMPYVQSVDPNYMYLAMFARVFGGNPYYASGFALFFCVVFVVLSQIKINMTNGYAGSIAWSNFFSRLTHTHPGRVVWVFFNVIIAYILMNYEIYSISSTVLNLYSIVAMAWCGTLFADLSINKRIGLSPKVIEFKRAYLYDINPVGFGSMLLSLILGYLAYFGCFGELIQAFSSIFTLGLTIIFCPLFAYLTKGKYYLSRPIETIVGKHECSVCKNSFDGEDLCYCPRYGGYICSLCCTLDSCCNDECKKQANIHSQIESLLPTRLRNTISTRVIRFSGHLLIYTLVNLIVLSISFCTIEYHFPTDARENLFSGFTLCFFLFEFIFCIFSMMFMLIEESKIRTQDEFHHQNIMLENEVKHRKKTEKLLQEAKENSDAANQAKTRYLSGISHELRTPLNTILGYGQILSKAKDIPENRKRAVDIMCRSSTYLADLIEGLLDISKIEAGRLDLHYDNVNIAKIIDDEVLYFTDLAQKKNIKFIYEKKNEFPEFVSIDEKRIRQIIINLLSNAVKYTVNGFVKFSISYRSEVAKFVIEDSGIGIKKEDLKKIFEPFNRLEEAKKKANGTGLGLTITNLLVTVMGGDLSVDSIYGKGTTFTLKIKMSKSMLDPKVDLKPKNVIGYKNSEIKKYNVLEVDDNESHRNLVKDVLSAVGFNVDLADCPDRALDLVSKNSYDLFLVDISMPGHDGWYLLCSLRGQGIKTPVIMVSAEASEGNVPEHIRRMHNGYIIKPFKQQKLFDSIAKVLPIDFIYEEEEPLYRSGKKLETTSQTNASLLDENSNVEFEPNKNAVLEQKSNAQNKDIIVLPSSILEQFKLNLEIGYIKGLRTLTLDVYEKNLITSEQKAFLDSLISKMNFEELKKVVGVSKDDDS